VLRNEDEIILTNNETHNNTDISHKFEESNIAEENFKIKGGKCYAFFKRLFDIFCSLLAIIILSPILLLLGLLVVCTSKGPMIYKSIRVGKNGKEFKMYKFRSMKDGAEKEKALLERQNEVNGGVTFKMKDDPRITKFGKFIRKTSLDELPQLFNILKGDMSIIGPRAALPKEVALYDERAKKRLLVPQGLSGEWQTHGRSSTTFEQMIDMDLDYIQNKRGFWYDFGLCFLTVWVVITHKGAE
jgi:lipopolysaccharide/colanic/teichoic acid biosynthesis glycosyltransferase